MEIFHNANYDFIRWRWHALILSSVLIIGGLIYALARHGVPLGIDFSGGTLVVLQFDQAVHEDQVRKALDAVPGDKVVQKYGDDAAHQVMVRLPQSSLKKRSCPIEPRDRSRTHSRPSSRDGSSGTGGGKRPSG